MSLKNHAKPHFEVYNKDVKRVIFQAPTREECEEWLGPNLVKDKSYPLKVRPIKKEKK